MRFSLNFMGMELFSAEFAWPSHGVYPVPDYFPEADYFTEAENFEDE